MIEKKRPRKLDSSKDARVRGADEMYDALNVQVSSDYDGDGSDSDGPLEVPLLVLSLLPESTPDRKAEGVGSTMPKWTPSRLIVSPELLCIPF